MGLPLDPVSREDLFDYALRAARAGERCSIMYLNAHTCNLALVNETMRAALCNAEMVYCDGDGPRLGARMLGHRVPARLTSADFLPELARECARHRLRIYLLGGREGVAEKAARELERAAPGVCIAGTHHGYFLSPRDRSGEVVKRINGARPHLVFVGMGSPLQEGWTCEHRGAIDAPVVWCLGAGMDFLSGRCRRAPSWMCESGLEWLFRLILEPRRLFVRYVIGNPLFIARVLAHRLQQGARA